MDPQQTPLWKAKGNRLENSLTSISGVSITRLHWRGHELICDQRDPTCTGLSFIDGPSCALIVFLLPGLYT